ncbi:MAG: hypothetical protein AAGJ80_07350, partial [Cyanobacteria bacterium J06553_1]
MQKEEGVLICVSPHHHREPKIELSASTRRGNNTFIAKHASHLGRRQVALTDADKAAVRKTLDHENNVDLDASPKRTPVTVPQAHEAVGVIENMDAPKRQEEEEEEVESDNDVLRAIFGSPSPFSFIPVDISTAQPVAISTIEPSLFLDELDPLQQEPEAAQLFNNEYRNIYQPGLQYPTIVNDQSMQAQPSHQHASTSMNTLFHPEVKDQSMQIDAPAQHHASTSMTDDNKENQDPESEENIPLLTQGLEHIREVNTMKNVMLTQLMQDNIELLETKIQSRKRALHAMEELFEVRAQTTPMNDDITLELSRIIHLKNKLIQQILQETATLHPHV